jgi:hypothetical protein
MDEKKLRRMVRSGKFISGVYNYCDRWCERCPLASRCALRAMELEDIDTDLDIQNSRFWRKLAENFAITRRMIEKECKRRGIVITKESLEEAGRQERRKDAKVRRNSLSKRASKYGFTVHDWFEKRPHMMAEKEQALEAIAVMELPGQNPVADAEEIVEAVSVLRWYQFFIGAKTARAVSGLVDMEEDGNEEEFAENDACGSAKIALIAIDRSLAAWACLRDHFPDEGDDILDFLVDLDRLRRETEKAFPKARDFRRPGFDDPKVMAEIEKRRKP